MGFNISGVVISKSYKDNLQALQDDLRMSLEYFGEVSFEEASANWKDEGICDVYFTDSGTLLFMSMDVCCKPMPIESANTLSFILSEMSMTFSISYCENGKLLRSVVESEDDVKVDTGNKLAAEEAEDDMSEVIWNQLAVMLGKNFHDIDLDEKTQRYLILPYKGKIKATKSEKANPWWKFW